MDDAYSEESHNQSLSAMMLKAHLCLDMSCTLIKDLLASLTMKGVRLRLWSSQQIL